MWLRYTPAIYMRLRGSSKRVEVRMPASPYGGEKQAESAGLVLQENVD